MTLKLIPSSFLFLITAFGIGFIDALRSDYTYISSTRAYYKLGERQTWVEARSTCWADGGWLFHPDTAAQFTQVLSGLAVGNNGGYNWMFTGMSDFDKHNFYETVDGRPISQVYSNWAQGDPRSGPKNEWHCVTIQFFTYELYVDRCDITGRFICEYKPRTEEVVATAIEEVKTVIAAALERQTPNQPSVLEHIVNAIMNQTRVLERLAKAAANQTAALERQAYMLTRRE